MKKLVDFAAITSGRSALPIMFFNVFFFLILFNITGFCVGDSSELSTAIRGKIFFHKSKFYFPYIPLSHEDDIFSCNKTTGEKEFVPCAINRLRCGQCTFFKQCINGKYFIDACPRKRHRAEGGYIVWSNQFFDPTTNGCKDYVRNPIKGRCHTYTECQIINTDFSINPISYRYEKLSENKCPPDASQFDPISYECTSQTIPCGNLLLQFFIIKIFKF